MRLFTVLLLLCSSMAGAQAQDSGLTKSVAAPSWHYGQHWRVQFPLLQGSVGSSPHDSATEFITYQFQVLGRRILRFEEQDGNAHIGQAVPPEDCWLVSITPDRSAYAFGSSYHLYFRADDLSLREVHLILRNGRGGYFMYSGTRVNDDDEAKAVVEVERGPFCNSMEPLLIDWPHFPLTVGGNAAGKKALLHESVIQTGTAEGWGIRVVLRSSSRETTSQTWLPGDPWWRFAERDGLRKSRLILSEQRPAHQVE